MLDSKKQHANVAPPTVLTGTGRETLLELLEPDREVPCVSPEPPPCVSHYVSWFWPLCVSFHLRNLTGSSAPVLMAVTPSLF